MPAQFDLATIDGLRQRLVAKSLAANNLVVPMAKRLHDKGMLHEAERLDEVANILDAVVDEIGFLLKHGRLATPQEALEFQWRTEQEEEELNNSDAA